MQIYTLPGSVRAVEEYMPTILETVEHLADMLHGAMSMDNTRELITSDEALALVIETAETLAPQTLAVAAACGLTLAEPIAADRDYPPFPRSMMDGFAVRVADAGQTLPIAGLLPAGSVWEGELPAGRCLEILTGRPVRPAPKRSCRRRMWRGMRTRSRFPPRSAAARTSPRRAANAAPVKWSCRPATW